jgi:glycosyltransferase involved in cell wall biosynthesis
MKLSIVIPAHNEQDAIGATLEGLLKAVHTPCEIIVVADHCSDRTEEIVREFQGAHPHIRLLRNEQERGFGNTVMTGLLAASGDAVVPFMADACDDPTTIDRMAQTMEREGVDVISASRYMRGGQKIGGPRLQNILSRIVSYSLCLFVRIPTWDSANAYKMYRTPFLHTLDIRIPNAGTEYTLAVFLRAWKSGAKIVEIPTIWTWKEPPLPFKKELKILRRLPGYWKWYKEGWKRSVHRS